MGSPIYWPSPAGRTLAESRATPAPGAPLASGPGPPGRCRLHRREARQRHLVLSEGARLVGHNDRHAAQRLRRAQLLDQHVLARQGKGAHPQHHGHDDGQLFGDGGKGERQAGENHVLDGLALQDADERDDKAKKRPPPTPAAPRAGAWPAAGRARLLSLQHQPGHVAQLGSHTRGYDHRPPLPPHHGDAAKTMSVRSARGVSADTGVHF